MSAPTLDICLIAALSADGFIARDPAEPSTAWTSAGDKKRFVGLSKQAGALVMGRKTFETFGCRPLKDRAVFVCSRQPPAGPAGGPCLPGATGVEWTSLGPAQLAAELTARGFGRLAVCGGSEIYSQYMETGLIRRLHLTIEPVLFGHGINLFNCIMDIPLTLVHSETGPEGSQFLDFEVKR
jgi:dihydrofolate reductase